jgi:hypothetical protein
MYQVVPYEEFAQLRDAFFSLKTEVADLRAKQPEWVREEEAMTLTGLSHSTLARERKNPDTLLVWKSTGGLRYERKSLLAFNEARSIRSCRYMREKPHRS